MIRETIKRVAAVLGLSAAVLAAGAGIGVAQAVAAPVPASFGCGTNRVGIEAYITADQRASNPSLSSAERVAALKTRALWAGTLNPQELAMAKCRR